MSEIFRYRKKESAAGKFFRKHKEEILAVVLVAAVSFCGCAVLHGCWQDYTKDEMHGTDCYWCNFYRYTHMDNAAFQTRELRRSERRKTCPKD